jgi:hypothetical protein
MPSDRPLGHGRTLIGAAGRLAQAVSLATDVPAGLALAQRLGSMGKAVGAAPRDSYIQVLFRHDR